MSGSFTRNMFSIIKKSSLLTSRNAAKNCRMLHSMYNSNTQNLIGNSKMTVIVNEGEKHDKTLTYNLPPMFKSYFEVYDRIPLLNINLPCMNTENINKTDIVLPNKIEKEVVEPETGNKEEIQCKHGMLKIRRKKMNKHKYQKRKKRDRAKLRKLFIHKQRIRDKKRRIIKHELIKKIEKIKENHPKSTYAERPYVVHRLTNW